MVRIGRPSSSAFSAGTAVSTDSLTSVVFAQVRGGVSVREKTILGSSAIRAKLGSSASSTTAAIARYVVAPISVTCSTAS
jgi:hypothetical protein